MSFHEHSDDWDSGHDTVTIPREWAYEPPQADQVRYLPVVGRYDNDDVTQEMQAIGDE